MEMHTRGQRRDQHTTVGHSPTEWAMLPRWGPRSQRSTETAGEALQAAGRRTYAVSTPVLDPPWPRADPCLVLAPRPGGAPPRYRRWRAGASYPTGWASGAVPHRHRHGQGRGVCGINPREVHRRASPLIRRRACLAVGRRLGECPVARAAGKHKVPGANHVAGLPGDAGNGATRYVRQSQGGQRWDPCDLDPTQLRRAEPQCHDLLATEEPWPWMPKRQTAVSRGDDVMMGLVASIHLPSALSGAADESPLDGSAAATGPGEAMREPVDWKPVENTGTSVNLLSYLACEQ